MAGLVDIREATQDLIDRYMNRPYAIEICEVMMVYPHRQPFDNGAGDRDFDTVDVKLRDVRMPPGSAEEIVKHNRALVLQRDIGNLKGNPWIPKVGDMVLVAFAQDEQAVIIGQLNNIFQEPVCRPTSNEKYYDIVYKICQHDFPATDEEYNYVNHPKPTRPPVCFKYFDRTRDTIFVHECKTGHESKYCNDCTGLDAIGCGSTYLMFRSSCGCGSDSEADPGTSTDNCPDCKGTSCSGACGCTCPECIDNQHFGSCKCGAPECPVCKGSTCGGDCGCSKEPKRRVKFHHHCGSVQIFDDDGTILIENYVLQGDEEVPKGHVKWHPSGTIEVHSNHNENEGAQIKVNSLDDTDKCIELRNLSGEAVITIWKDDRITISGKSLSINCETASMTCSGLINLNSETEIGLNAPIIKHNGETIHPVPG